MNDGERAKKAAILARAVGDAPRETRGGVSVVRNIDVFDLARDLAPALFGGRNGKPVAQLMEAYGFTRCQRKGESLAWAVDEALMGFCLARGVRLDEMADDYQGEIGGVKFTAADVAAASNAAFRAMAAEPAGDGLSGRTRELFEEFSAQLMVDRSSAAATLKRGLSQMVAMVRAGRTAELLDAVDAMRAGSPREGGKAA